MLEILQNSVVVCLCASFIILFISKIGFKERVETFGPKLISKAFSCCFCLSFWASALVSLFFYIFVTQSLECLLYPILSTPFTRKLVC